MGKELVISSNRHETKVAMLEDDQLVEIFFQRSNEYSLAGSIQKGRVTRVLPGMQSAFVDIGLDRDAFLYVTDFFEEQEEYDKMAGPSEDRGRRPERQPDRQAPRTVPAAAPPAQAEPAVAAAPAPEDDKDRRNRRSRRRRSRGRGFPDSKYVALSSEPAPAADRVTERVPERVAEPAAETDFAVLPGESLAKYHADAPVERVEREVVFEAPEADREVAEEVAAAPYAFEEAPEVVPESPAIEDVPGVVPEFESDRSLTAAAQILTEPRASASGLLEDSATPALDEAEAASEAAPDMPAEEPKDNAPSELRADVREPAARYPHRISRRMRRKNSGAAASEPRGDQQPARPEPAARPEIEPATVVAAERPAMLITDLLKEGQEILVQISKEPLGQKGARITSHIALPGRYVVYMPTVDHPGVSRKIASDDERLRLRRIIQNHRTGMPGGFIVRTAGEGKSESEIAADMTFLFNLWLDIRQKAEKRQAPAMIHHDLDIVQRLLRDQLADSFKAIWVDSEEVYESVVRFVERLQPALVTRVKLYTRPAPIFDAFNITSELEKALRPKVWLKSGGYIVVNQTEALVAIDVNTGKFVGKSNRLEDTIVKTNVEAIREIVRQMRLRDLGGIIVVDFIDMDERKNRQKVMQALEDEMRRDRAPYKILQFNDFGLVAITRKRVKQSLERTLCSSCPVCEGAGYVKSVQTVVGEILQEAQKISAVVEGPNVVLRVNPEVAKLLKSAGNNYLEELEEILRRPVLVTGDPLLHPEKWDMT
jgi:ribonuclease G